jgi:hypothetical protein
MLTRRSLLLGAAGSIPAVAAQAASPGGTGFGVLSQALVSTIAIRPAQGAALFSNQASIATNFDKLGNLRPTELDNMGGSSFVGFSQFGSVSGSLIAFLKSYDIPNQVMRLFAVSNALGFEHLVVDLLPPGMQVTFYDAAKGQWPVTASSVPILRVKAAARLGGVLAMNSWLTDIPRFWLGSWQMYQILLNSTYSGSQAMLSVWHYIQGYRSPSQEILPVAPGFPNFDPPTSTLNVLSPPQLFIPYGMTGAPGMLDFTVGGVPGSVGHSLQNTALESVIFSPIKADPAYTSANLVAGNSFVRPPFGAPNLFYPQTYNAAVHLTGGVVPGIDVGFAYNGGPRNVDVNGDFLFIDPSFNQVPGNNPIEPALDFGSPFDE